MIFFLYKSVYLYKNILIQKHIYTINVIFVYVIQFIGFLYIPNDKKNFKKLTIKNTNTVNSLNHDNYKYSLGL